MTEDPSRAAAVSTAVELIEPGMTIGLGSGRAVFALATAIGDRLGSDANVKAVVGSELTAGFATEAGIEIIDLDSVGHLDCAFDGADEVDPELRLIKGLGAAMLREKLIIEIARKVVIIVQQSKLVSSLGQNTAVPVEVIPYGWTTTKHRLDSLADTVSLRTVDGRPVTTDEGNYILDVTIPDAVDLRNFADRVKLVTGVVEHGLFLDFTDTAIVGRSDGTTTVMHRRE